MKVVFMSAGAREQALAHLLTEGVEVVAVITPKPTEENSRFQGVIDIADKFDVPHYTVDRSELYSRLLALNFDVLLSCGFSYLIDKATINLAKVALNVHPTLLPRYRGYRSGPYIVINGERESGVTVHQLTEQMDGGGILLQKSFPVTEFDTTKSVMLKTQTMEPELILEAIRKIESGNYRFIPQNENMASEYTDLRTPDDSLVDASKSLDELYNEIRACDPDDYPAFFYRGGERVYIKLWTKRAHKAKGEL